MSSEVEQNSTEQKQEEQSVSSPEGKVESNNTSEEKELKNEIKALKLALAEQKKELTSHQSEIEKHQRTISKLRPHEKAIEQFKPVVDEYLGQLKEGQNENFLKGLSDLSISKQIELLKSVKPDTGTSKQKKAVEQIEELEQPKITKAQPKSEDIPSSYERLRQKVLREKGYTTPKDLENIWSQVRKEK